jgi:hypothetical protein
MGESRDAYRGLVGKLAGNTPLRSRRGWENNIKTNLEEI